MTEELKEKHLFGPEFQSRIGTQMQAINMARALLTPRERQVMDVYYDVLARKVEPVLSGTLGDLEETLAMTPKPKEYDEIEAKFADLIQVILESGLSKVSRK